MGLFGKKKTLEEKLDELYEKGMAAFDAGNHSSALELFEKAAEQDFVYAQFQCGLMYDNGEGTATNKAKALYWFEKAAQQGNVAAQFYCGVKYYNGVGTSEDKARAKTYFQKAVAQTEDEEIQAKAIKILRERF